VTEGDHSLQGVRQAVLNGIVAAIEDQASEAAFNLAQVYLMLRGVDPTGYPAGGVGFVAPFDWTEG